MHWVDGLVLFSGWEVQDSWLYYTPLGTNPKLTR